MDHSPQDLSGSANVGDLSAMRLARLPATYLLPKDAQEAARLDFQDYALHQVLKTPYLAPLGPAPTIILDVGTGTGAWALKMARRFPAAQVIGIDRDPHFFKEPTMANCRLQVDDVLAGLSFASGTFSFVHQRLLIAAICAPQWPQAVRELVRVTSVGGWVELTEIDTQITNAGHSTWQLQRRTHAISRALGFERFPVQQLFELFQQLGLTQVHRRDLAVPLGTWGGRIGLLMQQNLRSVFLALKGVYCTQRATEAGEVEPLEEAEYEHMIQRMVEEWEHLHCSATFVTVYGKRVHSSG